jgi:polyphosphate kinase 2
MALMLAMASPSGGATEPGWRVSLRAGADSHLNDLAATGPADAWAAGARSTKEVDPRTQWYLQRYIAHLPAAGEMVMFDRSWYNRAGVERVMGFCSEAECREFMLQAPQFERALVRDGIHLIKLWFSVTRAEQRTRFIIRQVDPVRQWKLSPMDLASLDKWDDYTLAKEEMFLNTDIIEAPWTVIKSNDKKRGRLEAMRHVLSLFDYDNKDDEVVGAPDPLIVRSASDIYDEDHTDPTR